MAKVLIIEDDQTVVDSLQNAQQQGTQCDHAPIPMKDFRERSRSDLIL
jgi:hypothetical protein